MIECNFHSVFASLFNSLNSTVYRLKELEIQYDGGLSEEEKSNLLKTLRHGELYKNIKSPEKDPRLYIYERKLWGKVKEMLNAANIYSIVSQVEKEKIKEFVEVSKNLFERNLKDFNVLDNDNDNTVINLNVKGLNLFGDNKKSSNEIFGSDEKY